MQIFDDPDRVNGIIWRRPDLQIMKLHISDEGSYIVSVKTHWLRLIQRHWKKIMRQRAVIFEQRRHLSNIRFREINGNWPPGLRNLPELRGMMFDYTRCYSYRIYI